MGVNGQVACVNGRSGCVQAVCSGDRRGKREDVVGVGAALS